MKRDRIADEEGPLQTKKDRCRRRRTGADEEDGCGRRRTVIADEEGLELIEEGPLQTKKDCC